MPRPSVWLSGAAVSSPIYESGIGPGEADLILAFEPAEAVRMMPYLKKGGQVVVSSRAVQPVTATLSGASYDPQVMLDYLEKNVDHLMIIDADQALQAVGSSKVLNLILLGAAIRSGALGFSREDMRQAITDRIPSRFHELNFRALDYVPEEE